MIYAANGYEWNDTRLAHFIARHGYGSLDGLRDACEKDPSRFWDQVVDEIGIEWATGYGRTLDVSRGIMWPEWFIGGRLSLLDNLVTRHARAHPDKIALRWEGDPGECRTMTFRELDCEVRRLAAALGQLGVGSGDRVAMYLPMIPEAACLMLATVHVGAIVIPLFSGYGPESVTTRLLDCEPVLMVCANGYFRRGKCVPMLADARIAAAACSSVRHLLVVDRLGAGESAAGAGAHTFAEVDYRTVVAAAQPDVTQRSYPAGQPMMLAYTSGTTGKPKGVVHTHAGFPIKAAQDLAMAFDFHAGDTLMWVTDMGWLMGPWVVLGGLLLGGTIVLYEGTPDHPGPSRLWEIVERHGVTHLGLSPSLARLLMASDGDGADQDRIRTLRVFGSTGEPWNESPWIWLFEKIGAGRRPIINYSGGTEIGGGILGCFPGLPQKACGFNGPIPGMVVDVLDGNGASVRGVVGELVIRQPWPGMTQGFWRDNGRYQETYWSKWPNVWVHGDWARVDDGGFWFVHGRSDDTIKIAGKRIGPADFESALVSHDLVTEAVAIGIPDEMKGESVVCFVTVHDARRLGQRNWRDWEAELIDHVGRALGKPLRPSSVYCVDQIPKTRNGKLLRRLVRSAYLGTNPGDLSTVENPASIDQVANCRKVL